MRINEGDITKEWEIFSWLAKLGSSNQWVQVLTEWTSIKADKVLDLRDLWGITDEWELLWQ